MRKVVLDTETTGLDVADGHRMIEIGCIELQGRQLTGRQLHHYLNPQREIDAGAQAVHGIGLEQLQDKPVFADLADEILAFIDGAELVIHNAPFDCGFLNAEFELAGMGRGVLNSRCSITDTLVMARQVFPGQRVNLDALCQRYKVDNSNRSLHGALLDAEILAEVYLRMTGGQASLGFDGKRDEDQAVDDQLPDLASRPALPQVAVSAEAWQAHQAIWQQLLDKRQDSDWPEPPGRV